MTWNLFMNNAGPEGGVLISVLNKDNFTSCTSCLTNAIGFLTINYQRKLSIISQDLKKGMRDPDRRWSETIYGISTNCPLISPSGFCSV